MLPYFDKRLFDLLPPLYRIEDESGDLAAFLQVTAPTLDAFKDLIDRFPEIFDVDRCEDRFLPYLSSLVGLPFDGTEDPRPQRRRIKEAVPIYRRKTTIPAIRRALTDTGWQGTLEETFRRALRLGSRSALNTSKLPGQIFSLGVYRIVCENQSVGLREALRFHHPAGTRAFFRQWLRAWILDPPEPSASEQCRVRRTLFAENDETFSLNHRKLGSCFHLGRKQKVFHVCSQTSCTTLSPDFDLAAVCFASWHGRGHRMRLNTRSLGRRLLANCWESERKSAICCEIEARRQPPVQPVPMRLNRADLNEALLNHAHIRCRVRFKQKDFYGEAFAPALPRLEDTLTARKSGDSRLSHWLRTNRSRVSGEDHLNGKNRAGTFLSVCKSGLVRGGVTEAWDVVERWRRRGPVFSLNAHPLNGRSLTDANVTEERASFELRIETDASRVCPEPFRLGHGSLNRSGPRSARPDLIWLFRQKDHLSALSVGFTAAVNHVRATQWPV
jgi:phage tail-like protein